MPTRSQKRRTKRKADKVGGTSSTTESNGNKEHKPETAQCEPAPLKSLHEWEEWKREFELTRSQRKNQEVIASDKPRNNFRNYVNSERQERVAKFYKLQHTNQSYEYVKKLQEKYAPLNHFEMTVWEALEYLDKVVDDSDPDIDLTQIQHAMQTAEACRTKFPDEKYDWIHLAGLVHDLGKIMAVHDPVLNLPGEPQWNVVGDTFPVGCAFSPANVMFDGFKDNPDYSNPKYNTPLGIYDKECGLDNVTMSWGHDEYMYRVIVGNNCKLPLPALYIIRYHSFYPWHRESAYTELTNEQDRAMLLFVREFNECDLYSKNKATPNVQELAPYYKKLIDKYMPGKLRW